MLIDWFTVAAQAVNFIILVWLLQHFLYKPILAAIDAREKKIAAALAAATARQTEAQASRDQLTGKLKAFDDDRAAQLAQVTREAQAQRAHLLDAARRDAADLVAKQGAGLRAEAASLNDRMAQLATDEVFSIAAKALGELASAELEERLGSVFTQRLRTMSGESKAAFGTALRQSAMTGIVRSRVGLRDGEKATLRNAVNETFSADVHLEFETVATGDCGIELSAGGQRLGWSIQEYIKAFQEKARSLMAPALQKTANPAVVATTVRTPAVQARAS